MFLELTSFVARNMEISTFLATNPFNKLIRRNMEISIFLATIPLTSLGEGTQNFHVPQVNQLCRKEHGNFHVPCDKTG